MLPTTLSLHKSPLGWSLLPRVRLISSSNNRRVQYPEYVDAIPSVTFQAGPVLYSTVPMITPTEPQVVLPVQYSPTSSSSIDSASLAQQVIYSTPSVSYQARSSTTAATYSRSNKPGSSTITRRHPQLSSPNNGSSCSTNRTIFLSNLPYKVTLNTLKDLLGRAGRVERCDVHKDRRNPDRAKGTATATFRSGKEAAAAIQSFDGVRWEGLTIRVKYDREAGAVGGNEDRGIARNGTARETGREELRERRGEGPLVVNGSRANAGAPRRRSSDSAYSETDTDTDTSTSDGKLSAPSPEGANPHTWQMT